MESFIVARWAWVFDWLRTLSPFNLVRFLAPEKTKTSGFVDCWVVGHSVLAFLCLALSPQGDFRCWEKVALAYGAIRVLETVVYQANVLLFEEWRAKKAGKTYAVHGYKRLVILAAHTYLEILLWFALAFRNFSPSFESQYIQLDTFVGSIYFALVTVATIGYGDITPKELTGVWLVVFQSIIGLFMTLMLFARFVGLLRSPDTLDETEQ